MTRIPPSSVEPTAPQRAKAIKKWLGYGGLAVLSLILILTLSSAISHPIEQVISVAENTYQPG